MTYLIKYEKNIIERYGGDQVEKEPRSQVMSCYQFWIEYNLLRIVLLHYT